MLYWALVFLIVAIIAAIFGFGGVAVAAAGIAKLLFFIFLVVFIITLITGLTRRGGTRVFKGPGRADFFARKRNQISVRNAFWAKSKNGRA